MEATKEDIRYLEGKLKGNPNSILFARLADNYLSINRVDEAIELCEKGIINHPYYITGHYILSKCYLYQRKYDEAQKELKRVILFDPHYIAAHRDFAQLMRTIGWESSAESSYYKILEVDPMNAEVRDSLDDIRERYPNRSDSESEEMDLGEFDESSEKSPGIQDDSGIQLEDTAFDRMDDSFQKKFVRKDQTDEDAYGYILDEIFREDTISTHEDEELRVDEQIDPEREPVAEEEESVQERPADAEKEKLDAEQDDFDDFLKSQEDADQNSQEDHNETEDMLGAHEPETVEENNEDIFGKLEQERDPNDELIDLGSRLPDPNELGHWVKKGMKPDEESAPASDESEVPPEKGKNKSQSAKEKIVTPTLAEIYIAQHQYAKAINVYERLKLSDPDNDAFDKRIESLKRKMEEENS
ncbi:MAG: hypothetical protein V2J62_08025 [candidate division KSB1 bacterium]|jgi:tetratricopeptide (TPR) repeat protein|nr:hypothetical protein [candidate division KSB1 bacterium]